MGSPLYQTQLYNYLEPLLAFRILRYHYNHASDCILVFRNFPKPYFIGPVNESSMYML